MNMGRTLLKNLGSIYSSPQQDQGTSAHTTQSLPRHPLPESTGFWKRHFHFLESAFSTRQKYRNRNWRKL